MGCGTSLGTWCSSFPPGSRWNFPLQSLWKWHRILQSLKPLGRAISQCLSPNPLSPVLKGGVELPRMLGGAASSQSWEQDGITAWLGDVDLMGLGCGFMYGLGFWLLVRNPNQKIPFPRMSQSRGRVAADVQLRNHLTLLTQRC